MSGTGSDHAATFFCLDRVIVASEGILSFSFGGDFDPLFIGIEEFRSISELGFFQPCIFFGGVSFPSDKVRSVLGGPRCFNIRSILYSSSLSMRSGGGAGKFGPWISFS